MSTEQGPSNFGQAYDRFMQQAAHERDRAERDSDDRAAARAWTEADEQEAARARDAQATDWKAEEPTFGGHDSRPAGYSRDRARPYSPPLFGDEDRSNVDDIAPGGGVIGGHR